MKKRLLFKLLLTFCLSLFMSVGWVNAQNLLLNGDFEMWDDSNTPTSWTKVESITQESVTLHGGTYSAKHVGGTKDLGQYIAITGGTTYTISLWYYVESGDGTDARIWSYWKSGGSNLTDNADELRGPNNSYFTSDPSWQNYEVTLTAPATADELYFEVRTYSGATVYWDDMSVIEEVDSDPPVASWDPANGATDVYITTDITITFDEAIRNIDDSEIDNTNVASLLTLKETDATGADVAFTATIDGDKKVITISPDADLDNNQLYYVSIAAVEDENDNATTDDNITFTTVVLKPEPANHVTGFTATANSYNHISLEWTDAVAGTQAPDAYLIKASTGAITAPVDGTEPAEDTDLSDGDAIVKVLYAEADSVAFENLLPGTTYNFQIWSYTNEGTSIDYKLDVAGPDDNATTETTELFFSEYIEGSSNNKAIEIYNGTGSDVDLSEYTVALYANGAATPGNTAILSGILTNGEVYVITNSSANAEIDAESDITSGVANFNGNDAVGLLKNGIVVDVIGTIGEDPGSAWDVAGTSNATENHTLLRKFGTSQGNTDWTASAGTDTENSEWIVWKQDSIANLGLPTPANDDATISSTEYTVDDDSETITDIPYDTELAVFKGNLTPAEGATFEVYEDDETTVATDLATGYKVIVTAQDETTTKTYTITLDDPSTEAYVTSSEYVVDDTENTITGVPFETTLVEFEGNLTPATNATFETYEEDSVTVATDIATGYVVIVTAQDETTTKIYTVTVNDKVMDDDSYVGEPTTQIPAATIAVVDGDETAEAFEVFSFDINDVGTLDAEPTNVSQMVLFYGANFTIDLDTEVDTGWFEVDGTPVDFDGDPQAGLDSIAFSFADGQISVPDGGSVNVVLKVVLSPTVADGKVIQFIIDADQHGFEAETSGSGFAADFGADIVGNEITIDVVATELNFSTEPTDVFVNATINPAVVVEAIDANGNIDEDYTTDISIEATGATLDGSPVVVTPVEGVATFDALTFTDEGTEVIITASSGTLADATSATFNVIPEPEYDLFFSEYIEGSSYNKAIEIYNSGDVDFDLTPYVLKVAMNGGDWSTTTLDLTGTLTAGDVYVVSHGSAMQGIQDETDINDNTIANFNGDDALGLFKDDVLIDIIGIQGLQEEWDVAGVTGATKDHTLLRKFGTSQGNTDWTASAGTDTENSEWIVWKQDSIANLGLPTPGSDDATISSTEYTVNDDLETITDIPYDTELSVFKGNLTPAEGATFEVYEDDGTTVATDLATGYKVIVTAQDETTTKTYTITIDDPSTEAYVISSEYVVDDTENTITGVPFETTLVEFEGNLTPAPDATFETYEEDSVTVATDIATGYVVIVTAQDETTTKIYTITVNDKVMDADSYVEEPTTQIPAATIAVVDGDETAEAFEVFSFDINDVGTSDAEPTNVSQMVLFYGANFTIDFDTEIDTGWFEVDGTPVDFDGDPEAGLDSIAFSFADGQISVPDGGSVNVVLKVVLSPTVADGKVIQFMIDADQHGFEARTSGSGFAADFGTDIVGNDITIDAVATELNFATEPTDVYIDAMISPDVVVEAIDANGNIDTDYTTDVSITASGATLGGSPVVVTPVAGLATFDALSFSDEGTGVTLTASSGTLTDATSATFDVTAEPESDLFFSEYIEGSGDNKAVEIYNGTGADVDLSDYVVRINYNGNAWSEVFEFSEGTMIQNEDVYVIAHADAVAEIQAVTDTAVLNPYVDGTSYMTVFNGDDVRALCKVEGTDTTIIDIIGRYDLTDPGSGWSVAGVDNATTNHTLVRKPGILIGNADWDASAGTNEDDSEWNVYDQDYFDDLGSHSTTLSDEAEILEFTFGISIDAEDAVITSAAATVDIKVINGTDVTALTPTISISDRATIDPESGVEQDFTNPLVYTVTAADGTTTKDWTVTVTESATLSDKANIIEVELADVDSIKINETDTTVTIYAPYGFDVTSVKPEFTVSAGATIIDTANARDFTNPQVYEVTAQDGITIKNWEVSIVKPEPMELSIYEIQYTEDASGDSPYLDEFVKTSGIVTGVGGDGFFMQASAEEWNGIYVYAPDDNTATLGDSAWVVGTVDEYQEGTQISYVKDYIVIEQGVALPDPIEIADLATTLIESHEGMLVKLIGIECTDGPSNYQEWTFADESGDQIMVDDILGYQHTFTIGAKYTITGLRQTYFGDKITPRDAEDINEAPAISGITLDPTTPSSSDDVTVSATITDDYTDAASLSVALFYGNAEGSEDTEVTFAQVETTDEFEGTIPASDAEVFYKITASDGELTSTSTGSYSVSTSINNPDGIVSMNVYPNPSNGEFTLEMNASKAGTFTVEIINIQGQVIYQKQITQDGFYRESIDISEKAIGIYYIRITDGKSMRISKLMIQ